MARGKFSQPQLFTKEYIMGLVKAICRQLLVHTSSQANQVDDSEKIYSVALKLNGDMLNLIVKWNNGSKPSTYILKQLRFAYAPFKFIQALLKSPGRTIPRNEISDS